VNGLNDVDGPRGIRDGPQVLECRAKLGIDRTITDMEGRPSAGRQQPGNGPNALVNSPNDIDDARQLRQVLHD
jgi:hypothetical protein